MFTTDTFSRCDWAGFIWRAWIS